MESDWDVIVEIWNTISEGNLSDHLSFVHIKGHADKDKKHEELSLLQQLNVDADHLAGAYITMHWNDDFSKAPIYPTSGVGWYTVREMNGSTLDPGATTSSN